MIACEKMYSEQQIERMSRGFFLSGGPTACLLIHGLCGTPAELIPLGQYLHRQGCSVRGMLVAGHGTTLRDLDHSRWQDWVRSAEEAYRTLRAEHETVYVIGHSMGAALALHLAEQFDPAGVALLAPALFLTFRFSAASIRSRFSAHTPFLPLTIPPDKLVYVRGYKSSSRHGRLELRKLSAFVRKTLSQVTAPILVVHSVYDDVVGMRNAACIMTGVSSSLKKQRILVQSGHMIQLDRESDVVFAEISGLISGLPG